MTLADKAQRARASCERGTRNAVRMPAQSLVELALVAPVLILLAVAAWDGGSVLREVIVLNAAARDGARAAATTYGPSVATTTVSSAVLASARDLPGLGTAPGYLSLTYPDAQSVQVRLSYAHTLMTPVLRQLWGNGSGTLLLQATATFYLPQLTPVPATVVIATPTASSTPTPVPPTSTSTPSPTLTPSPTVTPSPTATPSITSTSTSTPTVASTPTLTTCQVNITIPSLVVGEEEEVEGGEAQPAGYFVTVQLDTPSYIDVTWNLPAQSTESVEVYVYSNSPTNLFAGQADPTTLVPPAGALASAAGNGSTLHVQTAQSALTGSFTVYFFDGGAALSQSTTGTLQSLSNSCPANIE